MLMLKCLDLVYQWEEFALLLRSQLPEIDYISLTLSEVYLPFHRQYIATVDNCLYLMIKDNCAVIKWTLGEQYETKPWYFGVTIINFSNDIIIAKNSICITHIFLVTQNQIIYRYFIIQG